MKTILLSVALFAGQMITMQDKPVVHLPARQDSITKAFGGSLLELINAPAVIHLPANPTEQSPLGTIWVLDVKNLGPNGVTIVGKNGFSVQAMVGQTIHIVLNGSTYSLKR
jgi:hypothetical protein